MTDWTRIADNLEMAFCGTEAPYIERFLYLTRWKDGKFANAVSFWADGILEIIAELLNAGYSPDEDYLLQAVAMLEAAAT